MEHDIEFTDHAACSASFGRYQYAEFRDSRSNEFSSLP